jgi:hypothetical protein
MGATSSGMAGGERTGLERTGWARRGRMGADRPRIEWHGLVWQDGLIMARKEGKKWIGRRRVAKMGSDRLDTDRQERMGLKWS